MALTYSQLPSFASGRVIRLAKDHPLTEFITDSRKLIISESSCFFAIAGPRHDGHEFVRQVYAAGIRQFVVEKELKWEEFPDANFFLTSSALGVIQDAATFHRKQFHLPVIGITGSNAKTIVKEWLFQLLSPDFTIVKNPGSYNSQLGVPLSVLQMRPRHNLGLFEAGISKPGEMQKIARIIQPDIGLFTNIGSSHDEGFAGRREKIKEKLNLFSSCKTIVYRADHLDIDKEVKESCKGAKLLGWGASPDAEVVVDISGASVVVNHEGKRHSFTIPLHETAHQENAIHCIVIMLHLGVADDVIQARLGYLKSVPMRMELKQGVNNSVLIDDTYNNDLAGLQISLDFLEGQQKSKKVLVISDILQSGLPDEEMVSQIAATVRHHKVHELVAVGSAMSAFRSHFDFINAKQFYPDTKSFLNSNPEDRFLDAAILIKGARTFGFERVVKKLERKIHGTVMEIDLAAVVGNLNFFKSQLKPGVRLMVMVKAFAYGSGSEEVATLLQYHNVDYLGVAYPDEGAELRRNNIRLPIMVMNPTEGSFAVLMENDLEPEIYNLKLLRSLITFLEGRSCKIHLKIDSGMHRLGFQEDELDEVVGVLRGQGNIQVASMFTHLAGSDEAEHDAFTRQQAAAFDRASKKLATELRINPIRHMLNSPGILRFPDLQYDMVRLGIGLYGIDPTGGRSAGLQPVATLKTIISQIKTIPAGETIGYGRRGVAKSAMKLATIAIGYADGFSRGHSRGIGSVLVNGKKAPVVGNVCMDMTMVDITGIDASEGDEVVIFGKELPITEVASRVGTIPYEILTSTSERVRRVFHAESF
jgi:alanine racemase